MPREILTLGLGNYGVLTAAQWANGLSRHDMDAGVVSDTTRRTGATVRLLLLDAPYASRPAPHHDGRLLGDDADVPEDAGFVDTRAMWKRRDRSASDDDGESDGEKAASQPGGQKAVRHRDPTDADGEDGSQSGETDSDEDVGTDDIGDFDRHIHAAPHQLRNAQHVPWWKFIHVKMVTNAVCFTPSSGTSCAQGDPRGDSVAHCFSRGLGLTDAAATSSLVYDTLRKSIEACDHLQGIQCFADVDSQFGGIGVRLAQHLNDEFDVKGVCSIAQVPYSNLAVAGTSHAAKDMPLLRAARQDEGVANVMADIDFASRWAEEVSLNRLLSIGMLSSASAMYTPIEVPLWSSTMAFPYMPDFRLDDDVAAAAVTAAAVDNAFYPCRVAPTDGNSSSGATAWTIANMCGLLRPENSLRLTALNVALPFPLRCEVPSFVSALSRRTKAEPPCLLDALDRGRLLDPKTFSSLSFGAEDWQSPDAPNGAVLGHVVTLRGLGSLKDERVPRSTVVAEYANEVSRRHLTALFDERYPLSGTFPADRLLPSSIEGDEQRGLVLDRDDPPGSDRTSTKASPSGGIRGVPVASHLAVSFSHGAYLARSLAAGQQILRVRTHVHASRYDMERDEWREVLEDVAAVRDSYDHTGVGGIEEEDDGGSHDSGDRD